MQSRLVQCRDGHRVLYRQPRRQDRRDENNDAGRNPGYSRHDRHRRGANGGRWRGADRQALSGRRWACWPHRGLQSARRKPRRAHARRERIRAAARAWRPHRRGAVSNSRGGSGARSRRLAAAQPHPHDWSPDADPAAETARTRPPRPEYQRPNNQRPNNQRPRGGQNLRPERAPQQPVNRPQRLPGQPRPRQRKNTFNQPKR